MRLALSESTTLSYPLASFPGLGLEPGNEASFVYMNKKNIHSPLIIVASQISSMGL